MTIGSWCNATTFLIGIDYFKKSEVLPHTLYIYFGPLGVVISSKHDLDDYYTNGGLI